MTCPPGHKHGENSTCYTTHRCRCDACRRGRAEYEYWRHHMAASGKPLLIDPTGTRRRLRALGALGWSTRVLGARYGRSQAWFSHTLQKNRVTPATAEFVKRIYDDLAMTPPVPTNRFERMQVAKTKRHAEANGYPPPLAWDDDSIDDPTAQPAGVRTATEDIALTRRDESVIEAAIAGEMPALSPVERREVIRILHGWRWSAPRIAEWIDCTPRTVTRVRKELGLPEWEQHEIRSTAA